MKRKFIIMATLMFCCSAMVAQPKSGGAPQLFVKIDTPLMSPSWSPNGSMLAFTGSNYSGLWTVDSDGNNLKQLTNENGAGYKMAWSNDGAKILCRTTQLVDKRRFHEIKTFNVRTNEVAVLVASSRDIQGTPTWKSVERVSFSNKKGLNTVNIKGEITRAEVASLYEQMVANPASVTSTVPALSQFKGKMIINPALSTTGKIAFQVPGKGVYVCDTDGSNLKSLGRGSYPAWLPDGKSIVVAKVKDDGNVITSSDLVAINIANGKEVNLTSETNLIPVTHSISPDGKKIAFENSENGGIYIIDLKY